MHKSYILWSLIIDKRSSEEGSHADPTELFGISLNICSSCRLKNRIIFKITVFISLEISQTLSLPWQGKLSLSNLAFINQLSYSWYSSTWLFMHYFQGLTNADSRLISIYSISTDWGLINHLIELWDHHTQIITPSWTQRSHGGMVSFYLSMVLIFVVKMGSRNYICWNFEPIEIV